MRRAPGTVAEAHDPVLFRIARLALVKDDITELTRYTAEQLVAAHHGSRAAVMQLVEGGPPVLRAFAVGPLDGFPSPLATSSIGQRPISAPVRAALESAAAVLEHTPGAPDVWRTGEMLAPVVGPDAAAVAVRAHGRPWGLLAAGPLQRDRELAPFALRLLQQAAELIGAAVERRHAEQALRESEQRFRVLVEGVRDYAIFLLDPAGRVASWNAGAAALFGWKAEDAIGRPISSFSPPEEAARGGPARSLTVATSERRSEEEGWLLRGDGSRFWAGTIVTALRDAGGRLRGFVQLTRDLTERKADEERQRLLREVQEALASRDEFLSMAGHELRTPVTSLELSLQALERIALRRGDAELSARVQRCERQTARLAHLVDDWLEIAQVGSGAVKLTPESVDLRRALERVLDHYREEAARAGCSLELQPGDPVIGTWDGTRIEQVFANLIANAIKYGPGQPIGISLTLGVNLVTVTVADRGIGVAAEHHSRIFERFGRAAPLRSYGGIGLGLYMTRRIVEAHGGSIRVLSTPGQGATFVVDLPLQLRTVDPVQTPGQLGSGA